MIKMTSPTPNETLLLKNYPIEEKKKKTCQQMSSVWDAVTNEKVINDLSTEIKGQRVIDKVIPRDAKKEK